MKYSFVGKKTRLALKVMFCIVAVVVILPLSLYIPAVQSVVKNFAACQLGRATGWDVSIGRLSLRFPLKVGLDDVLVIDEHGDTMLQAGGAMLDIQFLPLLRLDVEARACELHNAEYRMVSEDSSLVLFARLRRVDLSQAHIGLTDNKIVIGQAAARGGDVALSYFPEKVKADTSATVAEPWQVEAGSITLDSVHYTMRMMPLIDKMDVMLGHASLREGKVDMVSMRVYAKYLGVDSVDVRYIYPTPEMAAGYPIVDEANADATMQADSLLWTVTGDKVELTNSHAVYAMRGARPARGLDMNYIEAQGINFEVDSLYNRGLSVVVPLKDFRAGERSGVQITGAHGVFRMDSTSMELIGMKAKTVLSEVGVDGKCDMSLFEPTPRGKFSLAAEASIDVAEIEKMYPLYSAYLHAIPRTRPLAVSVKVSGSDEEVNIKELAAALPRYAAMKIHGMVEQPFDEKRLSGQLDFDGRLDNVNFAKPLMLDAQFAQQVNLPPLTVKGKASMAGNAMAGALALTTTGGGVVGDAKFNTVSSAYDVIVDMRNLPLHAFLPKSVVGNVTGRFKARGQGFDFEKNATSFSAAATIDKIDYNDVPYKDIRLEASLQGGALTANLSSANPNCDFSAMCSGTIDGDTYKVKINCDVNDLNLRALDLSDVTSYGKCKLNAQGVMNLKTMCFDVAADVGDLTWTQDTLQYTARDIELNFISTDTTITATLNNDDTHLAFSSAVGIKKFIQCVDACQSIVDGQIKRISLNIDTLQASLPPFDCDLSIGKDGLVQQLLGYNNVNMRRMMLQLHNDSILSGQGQVLDVDASGVKLDTISMRLKQSQRYLGYNFHLGNRPGTLDNFASVTVRGGIQGSRMSTLYEVKDIKGKTGYELGTHIDLNDSVARASIFTEQPVIAYREWKVNADNYVLYNYREQHLDANLLLDCVNAGMIHLYTNHHGDEHGHGEQENLNLTINDVNIGEWLSMYPYAPEVTGILSADMKIEYKGRQFWGDGKVGLKNLCYEGERVGDFNLDAMMTLDPVTGNTNLTSYMNVNGARVAFAAGVLNDSTSTSPLALSLDIDKFPISTASAFIPNGMAELQGYLNGKLTMTGTMERPVLNGEISADHGAIFVPMFGSKIFFPADRIVVENSVIKFDQYSLLSCNDRPLVVNGFADVTNLSDALVNLSINGNNVQFVDSKQVRKSQLFGRGFANVNATARGRLSSLVVNADVTLLSGSNLTYVLQDDVSEIVTSTNPDMVHFVRFADSLGVAGDSLPNVRPLGMSINARVALQQGNTINAYLSTDGKNRVQVQADGNLNYNQGFAGDPRVTGRLTVNSGYVKYAPPLISEVNFSITEGSYLAFTGEMLDPTLSLSAVEKYKATAAVSGGTSRLVNFLVTCNVGGSLSQMDVAFDMSTNDDMSVQNELQAMTAQQRSAQAVNLLLYGSYTGANASSMGSNALYSFLQSQINSWAASAIKGVDLSFGINQYDKGAGDATSMVTSYSYNLSKSLFNDRFKIVVGGKYSSDVTEDKLADNLISDISLEYMLNNSGSMYVRLFRHTGFESILEGEITQTGVGFVLKRKLSSLKRLFKFGSRRKRAEQSNAMERTAVVEDSVSKEAEVLKGF